MYYVWRIIVNIIMYKLIVLMTLLTVATTKKCPLLAEKVLNGVSDK